VVLAAVEAEHAVFQPNSNFGAKLSPQQKSVFSDKFPASLPCPVKHAVIQPNSTQHSIWAEKKLPVLLIFLIAVGTAVLVKHAVIQPNFTDRSVEDAVIQLNSTSMSAEHAVIQPNSTLTQLLRGKEN